MAFDLDKFNIDQFEWLGSGCCEKELWTENGTNCPTCQWFDCCGEGQDMVQDSIEEVDKS